MFKRMKYLVIAAGVGFLGLSAAVLAQVAVPQVSIINPTDLIQVIPLGQPSAQSKYATPAQITSQSGYYKSAPASLFSFTFGNSQSTAAFDPAGTLAYGYVTFSPAPSDGAQQCVFSTAAITTLYLSANTGQTLADAATTLAANGKLCYLYSLSNATWNRSQ